MSSKRSHHDSNNRLLYPTPGRLPTPKNLRAICRQSKSVSRPPAPLCHATSSTPRAHTKGRPPDRWPCSVRRGATEPAAGPGSRCLSLARHPRRGSQPGAGSGGRSWAISAGTARTAAWWATQCLNRAAPRPGARAPLLPSACLAVSTCVHFSRGHDDVSDKTIAQSLKNSDNTLVGAGAGHAWSDGPVHAQPP